MLSLRFLLLLGGFLLFLPISSQDIDAIFDDGTVANPTGAIKLDLLNLSVGEALVGFEYYVTGALSIYASGGPRIGDFRKGLFESYLDDFNPKIATDGGFNYLLEVRLRQPSGDRKGLYYGLAYHGRSFKFTSNGKQAKVNDLGLVWGYRLPLTARIHLEGDFTMFLRSPNDNFDEEYRRIGGVGFDGKLSKYSAEFNIRVGCEL